MCIPGMKLHDAAVRAVTLVKLSNPQALEETSVESAIWSIAPSQSQLSYQNKIFADEDWKAVALSHSILAE